MSSKLKLSKMSSPEAIANNEDLLSEILVCLPIKSIIKFKCVSKHWQSLISSHGFSRWLNPDTHLVSGLIVLHRTCGCLINPEYEFLPLGNRLASAAPFRSLTFVNHPSKLRILQSCNGLLLCSSCKRNGKFLHDYYIYNPTSRQYVALPLFGDETSRVIHRIGLAYDPTKSTHFKVVCIHSDSLLRESRNDPISYQVEVYSSQTGSWSLSGGPFVLPYNLEYEVGVFWNGAVNWIDWHRGSLYFKVDEEQLQDMSMPPTQNPANWIELLGRQGAEVFERSFVYFGESREHLHLVDYHDRSCRVKTIDIYEMERNYSGWFVKYRVDLDAIITAFPEMYVVDFHSLSSYHEYSILGIIREANDEDSYMVLHIPGKAIRYNLTNKTFAKICDFDPGPEGHQCEGKPKLGWFQAYDYKVTLAHIGSQD